jgi:hypothetical protein
MILLSLEITIHWLCHILTHVKETFMTLLLHLYYKTNKRSYLFMVMVGQERLFYGIQLLIWLDLKV